MCREVRLTPEVHAEILKACAARRRARAERDAEIAREARRTGRVRVVDRDARVRFNGRVFQAPLEWRGRTVRVFDELEHGLDVHLAGAEPHQFFYLFEVGRLPARSVGRLTRADKIAYAVVWVLAALAVVHFLLRTIIGW